MVHSAVFDRAITPIVLILFFLPARGSPQSGGIRFAAVGPLVLGFVVQVGLS
ncbi:hypothetical protein [Lysinibacter sp. HNR]|uniref:hypothetical protein n=1 Tax=Lysinibacter sp. HNR TaxID=3031408 RepID=UPI002435DAD7|nr:hypothetical protein [Lysinibacter sp. HNR]WGD38305.1 hypothetical protein FrondiHNR_05155 [Lysinibacter sp. HNR]